MLAMLLGTTAIMAPRPSGSANLEQLYAATEVRAAEKAGQWGAGRYRVTVAPDGSPVRCQAIMSAGDIGFGNAMCASLMSHVRFKPAQDGAGTKMYGTYSESFGYLPKGSQPGAPLTFEAWFDVNHLTVPKGWPEMGRVRADVLVDPDGRISNCVATMEFGPPQLQSLTCPQIAAAMHPAAAMDAAGEKVASVQMMEIVFAGPGAEPHATPVVQPSSASPLSR